MKHRYHLIITTTDSHIIELFGNDSELGDICRWVNGYDGVLECLPHQMFSIKGIMETSDPSIEHFMIRRDHISILEFRDEKDSDS